MPDKELLRIPFPTVRRLPRYLQLLRELPGLEERHLSATWFAERLDLDPIQVRKDLACTGASGTPRKGFAADELCTAILEVLGWNNRYDAFLIGAGNLGSALLGYDGFREMGLNIVAAFDTNPQKTGTIIHGHKILPVSKLPDLAARLHIRLAVLTVDRASAQECFELAVDAGIRGIWNFAPVQLSVPAELRNEVVIQSENLAAGLALLSFRLQQTGPA